MERDEFWTGRYVEVTMAREVHVTDVSCFGSRMYAGDEIEAGWATPGFCAGPGELGRHPSSSEAARHHLADKIFQIGGCGQAR